MTRSKKTPLPNWAKDLRLPGWKTEDIGYAGECVTIWFEDYLFGFGDRQVSLSIVRDEQEVSPGVTKPMYYVDQDWSIGRRTARAAEMDILRMLSKQMKAYAKFLGMKK